MKIVFISYNFLPGYTSAEKWINRIRPGAVIMEALGQYHSVNYVGQIGYIENYCSNNVQYYFIKKCKSSRFPWHLHSFVKQLNPDIVVIPGFHFPLQVIQLRLLMGKKIKIILEHHADKPSSGLKKLLQKTANKFVNAYHFTSYGNAEEWLQTKIIATKEKCYEIQANSAGFLKLDKYISREKLAMNAGTIFLWVGRLNKNKAPLTVLEGFDKYLSINADAELHMIYHTEEIVEEVKQKLQGSKTLSATVSLQGKIEYNELPVWYSAADFFISGSHSEGGSIALLEAMSCGCIPIVTAIPAALKTIEDGKYGFYYKPGNSNELFEVLKKANSTDKRKLSSDIEMYFKDHLSPIAIAQKFISIWDKKLGKHSSITEKNIYYYDNISAEYNELLEKEDINTIVRKEVSEKFMNIVKPCLVLDLGGGTGKDLDWLVSNNYSVIFCEPSKGMRKKAMEYSQKIDQKDQIHFLNDAEVDFLKWKTKLPNTKPADAILSNFAVINCIPNINVLFESVAAILKPGAHFIAVILENSFFKLLRYHFLPLIKSVFLRKPVTIRIHYKEHFQTVFIYSIKEIKKASDEYFNFHNAETINRSGFCLIHLTRK